MTREELAKEIAKRMKEIRDLYYEEYPEGDYLSLYFRKNIVSFSNDYWEGGEDEGFLINYYECDEFICTNEKLEDK